MISQIVSTSPKPVFGYLGMAYAMVAIGGIFVVWAHHTYTVGITGDGLFRRRHDGDRGATGVKIFS
jgi:cytochrome c oxidase subunit 1